MINTLAYVFGPDGAGKSTIAEEIRAAQPNNSLAFNASKPDSWPDPSWHKETIARGIDSHTLDPSHHMERLARCYRMANHLLQTGTALVVIDSDPRAQIATKATAWYDHPQPLEVLHSQLDELANQQLDPAIRQIGIHVTVGQGTPEQRASTLLQRINDRCETSFFDPTSLCAAHSLVLAFDALEKSLQERGVSFVRIETDRAVDMAAVSSQLV